MKKYIFSIISIISIISGILLNLSAFVDVTNIYNKYILDFFALISNEYIIYSLSFISIWCAIISFKKYKEQILSSIALILNIPLVLSILLGFIFYIAWFYFN